MMMKMFRSKKFSIITLFIVSILVILLFWNIYTSISITIPPYITTSTTTTTTTTSVSNNNNNNVFFYMTTTQTKSRTKSSKTIRNHNNNNKNVIYVYSTCRGDRSGALVHDMIFAHAYVYNHYHHHHHFSQLGNNVSNNNNSNSNSSNSTALYAGCCADSLDKNRRTLTTQLLVDLHWDMTLPLVTTCPKKLVDNNNNKNDDTTTKNVLLLHEKTYRRDHDVNGFHPEWRQFFIQEINRNHPHQNHDTTTTATTGTTKTGISNINHNTHKNKKNKINNDNTIYTIAVHIRRGDVNPCKYNYRYLPNSHYMELIQQYKSILLTTITNVNSNNTTTTTTTTNNNNNNNDDETKSILPVTTPPKIDVTIYSEQWSFESFDIFTTNPYKYTLSLDDPLSTVWKALSTANVAILSRSSFSYVPAIMNPNIVVYTPFWHQPMSHWDVVNDELLNRSMNENKWLFHTKCNQTQH